MRAPRLTPVLDEFLAVRLATTGAAARRELDRACRGHGRPLREVLALIAAADLDERLTPTSLADRLGLQRSEVSRVLNQLKYEGEIAKRGSLYDERAHVVIVASRDAVLTRGREPLAYVERSLRRSLTRRRQKQLAECLEALKGPANPVAEALSWL